MPLNVHSWKHFHCLKTSDLLLFLVRRICVTFLMFLYCPLWALCKILLCTCVQTLEMLISAAIEKQVSSAVWHKLTLMVEQCFWWQWHHHILCHRCDGCVFAMLPIASTQHCQSRYFSNTSHSFMLVAVISGCFITAGPHVKSWVTFYDAFGEQSSTGTVLFLGFSFSGLLLTIVPQLPNCYHFFWCVIVLTKQYRGADRSLARPTPHVFCLMVRIFHLMLVLLYI